MSGEPLGSSSCLQCVDSRGGHAIDWKGKTMTTFTTGKTDMLLFDFVNICECLRFFEIQTEYKSKNR